MFPRIITIKEETNKSRNNATHEHPIDIDKDAKTYRPNANDFLNDFKIETYICSTLNLKHININ